jgi:hypothetical protein
MQRHTKATRTPMTAALLLVRLGNRYQSKPITFESEYL